MNKGVQWDWNKFDSEILSSIIKNHLAQNGYYLDVDSLVYGNGLKEIVDVIDDNVSNRSIRKKEECNPPGMEWSNARKNNKKCRSFY